MDHLGYPFIQKAKCFVPSFKLIAQSHVILQDVFVTTLINSRKFTT
jgi:hypothetical protein